MIVEDNEGMRLDSYLAEKLELSRSKIQKLVKDEKVFVNGKNVNSSYSVKIGDNIEVDDELDELIDQRDALKESKKTYEDLDKQIKEKVGDRPKVLSGKYLITVTTSVTPEHVEPEKVVPEKVVRRFKYQKIGD